MSKTNLLLAQWLSNCSATVFLPMPNAYTQCLHLMPTQNVHTMALTQSANHPISTLPGLGRTQVDQLNACGIFTTFDLLRQGNSLSQRQQLSRQLNTNIKHINKWAALANLARIPGVGPQHCGLLLHAGISTPQQLAGMTVQRLHPLLRRLQVQLIRRADLAPDTAQVATWVAQAKTIC